MGSGGAGVGGAAAGGSSGGFAAVAAILGKSCGTGMCHDAASGHVDLRNDSGLRARLVGVMPSGSKAMAGCKTMTLVTAGAPASSLLSKVVSAAVTGCAARMPDECSTSSSNPRACLTTAQIATIDSWITAGAM